MLTTRLTSNQQTKDMARKGGQGLLKQVYQQPLPMSML